MIGTSGLVVTCFRSLLLIVRSESRNFGKGVGGRNRQLWKTEWPGKVISVPKDDFYIVRFIIKYFQNCQRRGRGGGGAP